MGSALKRKESLRDSYAKKLKAEGRFTSFEKRNKCGHIRVIAKKRKPLKKQSRSQRERLKKYFPIRNEFLAQPENQYCSACGTRGIFPPRRATEVHHSRSRNGDLLFDTRFFIATDWECGRWIHDHPREARELGLLAPANEWGTVPTKPLDSPAKLATIAA